jgi:hypothetical protein
MTLMMMMMMMMMMMTIIIIIIIRSSSKLDNKREGMKCVSNTCISVCCIVSETSQFYYPNQFKYKYYLPLTFYGSTTCDYKDELGAVCEILWSPVQSVSVSIGQVLVIC